MSKCLIAPLLVDAHVERLNDAYSQAVKNIKSQVPVGDAAQHYYAKFVTPQSQHQTAPPPAEMVNERLDHLQEVLDNIDDRLNNAISREEHMTLVEEQRKTREEVNHLLSFVRTLFQQNSAFQQPPPPPPSN